MVWTNELDEEVRELLASGKSAGEVANKLGVSRNAILGRAWRKHWECNNGLRKHPPAPPKKPKAASAPKPKARRKVLVQAQRDAMPKVLPRAAKGEFPNKVLLVDARTDQCKFPIVDKEPWFACGDPVTHGSVYCAEHHLLCYNRPLGDRQRH